MSHSKRVRKIILALSKRKKKIINKIGGTKLEEMGFAKN